MADTSIRDHPYYPTDKVVSGSLAAAFVTVLLWLGVDVFAFVPEPPTAVAGALVLLVGAAGAWFRKEQNPTHLR